ncbi:hypothetical protein BGZ73_004806 [Actinomortierella ambigua]|nr:hypothetical protein BGZ73_004806 [Actinomortierella ambigua]
MATPGEPGAPPAEDPPKIARLRSFLNRPTRITITDGRIFQGQLMCIDNSKNIVLSSAYEISPVNRHARRRKETPAGGASRDGCEDDGADLDATNSSVASEQSFHTPLAATSSSAGVLEGEKRYVGLVMVPGPHIVGAQVDTTHLRSGNAAGVPSASATSAGRKYDADYLMG